MAEGIGFEVKMNKPYNQAVEVVTAALKSEGFGVLTSIDVKATMKEKLDEDFRPYVILGACNPPLAHRALTADSAIGLMLPCNVTIEEDGHNGALVRIIDPEVMMGVGEFAKNPEIQEVAESASNKLKRVAQILRNETEI